MRSFWVGSGLLLALATACNGGGGSSSPASPSPATTTSTTSTSTTTTTAAPTSQVLRRATFQSANGYTTEGSVRIVQTGSEFALELQSDFRTSQSAALDVRLCVDINCRGAQLDLGGLKAFSGTQTYALPNDGGSFSHAVIYCRAVRLAFGFGVLQ